MKPEYSRFHKIIYLNNIKNLYFMLDKLTFIWTSKVCNIAHTGFPLLVNVG